MSHAKAIMRSDSLAIFLCLTFLAPVPALAQSARAEGTASITVVSASNMARLTEHPDEEDEIAQTDTHLVYEDVRDDNGDPAKQITLMY